MRDAVGQMLHIGDRVAYVITDSYSGMQFKAIGEGIVEGFTPKKIKIKDTKHNHAGWWASGEKHYTTKVPHRIVKIPEKED